MAQKAVRPVLTDLIKPAYITSVLQYTIYSPQQAVPQDLPVGD